jgi:hypothetical protein
MRKQAVSTSVMNRDELTKAVWGLLVSTAPANKKAGQEPVNGRKIQFAAEKRRRDIPGRNAKSTARNSDSKVDPCRMDTGFVQGSSWQFPLFA